MAAMAYLRLVGQRQGEIRGGVVLRGHEGAIGVLESNHEVAVPLDVGTGLPHGRIQHRPFVVVKEIDRATPALYRALVEHEVFERFELQYWAAATAPLQKAAAAARPRATAARRLRLTVRLAHARLMGLRFVHPDVLDPALKGFPEAEELSFAYQSIEWAWADPADSVSSDWAAPTVRPRRRATDA